MTSSWKKWLKTALEQSSSPNNAARVAIIGVGNELNGDDGAGVLAVRLLKRRLERSAAEMKAIEPGRDLGEAGRQVLALEAGLAPENFTGVLRKFSPVIVLILDAARLDQTAGATMLLDGEQLGGFGASTHLQPLATFSGFLKGELGCEVRAIGIQPVQLDFGRPITPAVQRACRRLANGLAEIFMPLAVN